ncbi:MAG: protein-L-isoaspartate(D-aspartate) O-methyltransferase [Woeseiaceae bacterium]|nr:protein-L-isoaspartate(D-aspartate) O-methyltransferase [Woeseiaceae bacterium]
MSKYEKQRERMVKYQVEGRGVHSDVVLAAMRKVPREQFIPEYERAYAYNDGPLPIGEGQTISQPFVVAFMIEALKLDGGEKVLEIGTGSGYAAAVLAEVAGDVYTIERLPDLAERSTQLLAQLGYDNVHVRCGDGTLGWPEQAPFGGIVVTAGGPDVPVSLREQLAVGASLVIPVGDTKSYQELRRVTRVAEDDYESETLTAVRFVPLVGEQGWPTEY